MGQSRCRYVLSAVLRSSANLHACHPSLPLARPQDLLVVYTFFYLATPAVRQLFVAFAELVIISKNYTLRLVPPLPPMHRALPTQIDILDGPSRTHLVRMQTLCLRTRQTPPDAHCPVPYIFLLPFTSPRSPRIPAHPRPFSIRRPPLFFSFCCRFVHSPLPFPMPFNFLHPLSLYPIP